MMNTSKHKPTLGITNAVSMIDAVKVAARHAKKQKATGCLFLLTPKTICFYTEPEQGDASRSIS